MLGTLKQGQADGASQVTGNPLEKAMDRLVECGIAEPEGQLKHEIHAWDGCNCVAVAVTGAEPALAHGGLSLVKQAFRYCGRSGYLRPMTRLSGVDMQLHAGDRSHDHGGLNRTLNLQRLLLGVDFPVICTR